MYFIEMTVYPLLLWDTWPSEVYFYFDHWRAVSSPVLPVQLWGPLSPWTIFLCQISLALAQEAQPLDYGVRHLCLNCWRLYVCASACKGLSCIWKYVGGGLCTVGAERSKHMTNAHLVIYFYIQFCILGEIFVVYESSQLKTNEFSRHCAHSKLISSF